MDTKLRSFTVNVRGGSIIVSRAKAAGFHAYHANGVAAIEIKALNKTEAERIARVFSSRVYYVFE